MATVLLVEDEVNQRRLFQMELEDEGHRVTAVPNGREAHREVEDGPPDLVVLDPGKPGMNGLDTLDYILRLNVKPPVIIYSAYDAFTDDSIARAADAFVTKSSNIGVLIGETRRILHERKQQRRVWNVEEECTQAAGEEARVF